VYIKRSINQSNATGQCLARLCEIVFCRLCT